MTITSLSFVLFVFGSVLLYYIVPKKLQWIELLGASVLFYFLATTPYTIIYIVLSALIAYFSTLFIDHVNKKELNSKLSTASVTVAICLNLLLWFIFKAKALWSTPIKILLRFVEIEWLGDLLDINLLGALGMGYYTFQIISYILDCYWGTSKVQKNPFKVLLFAVYFPQLTTGPISRYSQLESLFEPHKFESKNITWGVERFVWGLAKKIVLAERVAVLIQNIEAQADVEGGIFILLTILLYPVQMYADFSGCCDIVIGISQLFGIKLPENFNSPFLSRNTQEFWQRWHITLGSFAKDYVLYPVLRTKAMSKISKFTKSKFGKKYGRLIATAIGSVSPWFVIAVWHGAWRFLVGTLLWNWSIMTLSSFLQPYYKKANNALHIKTESAGWHVFQSVRTYILYSIGIVFFNRGILTGVRLLANAFGALTEPKQLFFGLFHFDTLLTETFTLVDFKVILVMLVALFAVAMLREKYGYAREWVDNRFIAYRWLIILALVFFVIIFGKYGPGFVAADFIYQGF